MWPMVLAFIVALLLLIILVIVAFILRRFIAKDTSGYFGKCLLSDQPIRGIPDIIRIEIDSNGYKYVEAHVMRVHLKALAEKAKLECMPSKNRQSCLKFNLPAMGDDAVDLPHVQFLHLLYDEIKDRNDRISGKIKWVLRDIVGKSSCNACSDHE